MPRGPSVPVETCLRCGGDTAAARRDRGVRHRIQLVDAPPEHDRDAVWGQLCPACWTAIRHVVAGADRDDVATPPADPPLPE